DEDVSRQLLLVGYDETEVAGRVVHADDGLPRPLEHLDDPTFGPLPAAPLLHSGDDAVAVHRRPHTVPRHEQVPGAVLRHHEAGAAADRVESADDEVDLLGSGVPLLPDPVDEPFVLEALELGLELGIVGLRHAQSPSQLLRLQRPARLFTQVFDDGVRLDRHDHLSGQGMWITAFHVASYPRIRTPLSNSSDEGMERTARRRAVTKASTALARWFARTRPRARVAERRAPSLSSISRT